MREQDEFAKQAHSSLVTLQDSSKSQCMQDLDLSYKGSALYSIVARYALWVDYGHCRTRIATALAGHAGPYHATIFFKDMSSVLQSKANNSVVTPSSQAKCIYMSCWAMFYLSCTMVASSTVCSQVTLQTHAVHALPHTPNLYSNQSLLALRSTQPQHVFVLSYPQLCAQTPQAPWPATH